MMDRSNLGFALFMALLLVAPSIPVPGLPVSASLSPAAAGFVLWFMLASRLPIRAVLAMPTVLALIGFSIYALLVSLVSGRLVSIMYASQYAFYTVAGGLLIPAYLVHKLSQGREIEVWRIVGWLGAIFVAGIIVSLWTGPIYAFQDFGGKLYQSHLILRARGFSESANAAGGIAALLAAFYLFLYRTSPLRSMVLMSMSLLGLGLTLSRSAMLAFAMAIVLLGGLLAFRAVFLKGRVRRVRLRMVPIGLVLLGVVAGTVSYQQPIVAAAWERLVLDQEYLNRDIDQRLEHWGEGGERWVELPQIEQIIGAGFRSGGVLSSRTTFVSSHNFYVEILVDFGIIGLLIFLGTLIVALMRATRLVLLYPADGLVRFCWCGLMILIIHNMTQVFFYDMATLVFLILLLTCLELAGTRAAAMASGAVSPAANSDRKLRGVSY